VGLCFVVQLWGLRFVGLGSLFCISESSICSLFLLWCLRFVVGCLFCIVVMGLCFSCGVFVL
jgi:hypothetical protein